MEWSAFLVSRRHFFDPIADPENAGTTSAVTQGFTAGPLSGCHEVSACAVTRLEPVTARLGAMVAANLKEIESMQSKFMFSDIIWKYRNTAGL